MNILDKTITNTELKAKVIQILAGGEIVTTQTFHTFTSISTTDITAVAILQADLPYTTATPSALVLVQMDGTATVYRYASTKKHGTRSFTYTYLNPANEADVIRLVNIL